MAIDNQVIERLNRHISELPERFNNFSEGQRLHRPAPGKWSKLEIVGHLIDSAINNLKRFTEIQFLPQPYAVIRYQQDNVVIVNHYQQLPHTHLLDLWRHLNTQIFYVITHVPSEKLSYVVITPNGDEKNLEWLITDYVDHMEHHMRQIFGSL